MMQTNLTGTHSLHSACELGAQSAAAAECAAGASVAARTINVQIYTNWSEALVLHSECDESFSLMTNNVLLFIW